MKLWIYRIVVFAGFWVVLSGANFDEPLMVAGIILLSAATSIYVLPAGSWCLRPLAVIRFMPYFVKQSVAGGWDVAKRAFAPKLNLEPKLIVYKSNAPEAQKVLLAWITSLLPGTAAVTVEEAHLRVHVLDASRDVEQDLRELERRIRALFEE